MNMKPANFWEDRKVLVTGATGLLGSALIKELNKRSADTVCLIRDWVPKSEVFRKKNIDTVSIVSGTITNQQLVERVLGEYEIEVVFHLAAQTIVSVANKNPVSTFESNIQGTWTILEACRRSPAVNSVIVASSDKAYGCQQLPYTEDKPLKGIYPYDVSKACVDMLSQSYAKTYGLPVAVTRCANFYGEGDLNWNRIIPGTIRSVIRGQPPIIRSDGKTVRDYLYIQDAAEGYISLARHLVEHVWDFRGEAFNLATDRPITTELLVDKILTLMKSELPVIVQNSTTNEIQEQWLSAEKANRMLNWYPAHTLEEGLTKTIKWYSDTLR
jgi:CDP-glucose 4,6-dehydratase